jgi:hypothetical protein
VRFTGRGRLPVLHTSGSYRLRIETSPRFGTNFNLGISNSDEDFHFVLLARREIHGKIGDIAGFETDHLHPFVIRKIRQGLCLLHPGFHTAVVREFSFLIRVRRCKTGTSSSIASPVFW